MKKKKTVLKNEISDQENKSEINSNDKISGKKDIFEYKLTEDEKLTSSRRNKKSKTSDTKTKKINVDDTKLHTDEEKYSFSLNSSCLSIESISKDLDITEEVN